MYSTYTYKLLYVASYALATVGAFSAYLNKKSRLFYSTEKSRHKFFLSILAFAAWLGLILILTIKLWVLGENNTHFNTMYAFSCVSVVTLQMQITYYVEHDNLITIGNHILCFFPRFMSEI